jgi:RNA ligase
MNYDFPIINNISDVLPAIEGRDEFTVAQKDGYTVINYNVMFEDTFPPVKVTGGSAKMRAERSRHNVLRRECRGIMFDSVTGDIIRRPFHKFFNVNERDETQDNTIDMSKPHVILEKLDGSMVAPFYANDLMLFGTKMGATDVAKPVEAFVNANPKYIDFSRNQIENGFTPIFEWCSRKQRIVLDYPEDQLILTGLRHLETGEYVYYDGFARLGKAMDIPVVRAFDSRSDMKEFIEYTRDLENLEGFVVRFDDGHMLKLKCEWYLQIHRAKEAILQDRNIVELILDEHLDDVKPHLLQEDRDRINKFENDFNQAIMKISTHILDKIVKDVRGLKISRKDFALVVSTVGNQKGVNYIAPIIFTLWDTNPIEVSDVDAQVRKMVRKYLNKIARYEEIRAAWFPNVIYNI